MSWLLDGFAWFGRKLLLCDWLNLFLCISVQITFTIGLFLPFRKWIAKAASYKYIIRVLCAGFVSYLIIRPFEWELFDLRDWYGPFFSYDLPPLLRIYIPAQIKASVQALQKDKGIDWLFAASVLWAAGHIFLTILDNIRARRLRRLGKQAKACPYSYHQQLKALIEQKENWTDAQRDRLEEIETLELIWLETLPSPCTYEPSHKHCVIALNRNDYSEEELRLILLHELTHIANRHQRALANMHAMRISCWFNPVLYLAEKWCRQQMELVTDEDLLGSQKLTKKQRISYARLLVNLAEESQLSGAALYLSAGAQFVMQRTQAILHPQRKSWSLPITILIIIVFLHTSLLIAPGEDPAARFSDKSKLAACLGSHEDSILRGLDPLAYSDYSNQISLRFVDWRINIKLNDSDRAVSIGEIFEPDSSVLLIWKDFVQDYIGAFGEPSKILLDGAPSPSFEPLYDLPEGAAIDLQLLWPVEMSEQEKSLFWDTIPEKASLSLSIQYPMRSDNWYGDQNAWNKYQITTRLVPGE